MPTRTTTAAGATSQVKEIPSPPVAGLPAGPLGHGWELGQFLPLDGELDEDGTHLVSDAMLLMYGSGQSWPEALQDYISSLIDYYRLVQQGADRGSDKDRRELERIHGYLHPVSH